MSQINHLSDANASVPHVTLGVGEWLRAANENDVLVAMEVHKRWDPVYLVATEE